LKFIKSVVKPLEVIFAPKADRGKLAVWLLSIVEDMYIDTSGLLP
jgi:hypothetical protein